MGVADSLLVQNPRGGINPRAPVLKEGERVLAQLVRKRASDAEFCSWVVVSTRRYRCWFVRFYDIKRDLHDELRLAIYTPFGVCIYVHDGALGVQTSGRAIAIQLLPAVRPLN